MKGYKGFDKELKCRNMQYEVGKTYKEDKASLCNCGLHFCENPLDVFNYYAPADSRYASVEADKVDGETSNGSKRVAKQLKINAEIGLPGLIKESVEYIKEQVNWDDDKISNTGNGSAATNTGDRSATTNTGNGSVATNTGNRSVATNTGGRSVATNTGGRSAATNTGDRSAATNTGNQSAATNTGDQSAATNTGDWSAATNTGDRSVATNTGAWSAATVDGKESVAIALGIEARAKGNIGSWIVLAEWENTDE